MSVSLPSFRWYLIAMPCGIASAEPSGTSGMPVPSEKRTVTGIVPPSNSDALLSFAASGEAVKLPSTTMPLAWLARNPGWVPNTLFMASTIWVSIGTSSARSAVGRANAANASAARRVRFMRMSSVCNGCDLRPRRLGPRPSLSSGASSDQSGRLTQ